MRVNVVLVAVGVALLVAGLLVCRSGSPRSQTPPGATATPDATRVPVAEQAPYEPLEIEPYANGKRLAGRVAQAAVTFAPGDGAADVAAAVPTGPGGSAPTGAQVADAMRRGHASTGEVVYAQLSGVTATSLGVMVVVRQRLQDADGRQTSVTRAMDVRLRRSGGSWALDELAGVGGEPVRRPDDLGEAARRVVEHRGIRLPDSARWDIFGGGIDDALLDALADAADRRPISVAVLRTGHPPNVWASETVSAHTRAAAADVYAVGGRLVVAQRETDSPAYALAAEWLANGAAQVGSPWVLAPGAPRSFTDAVHADHVHLQQTPG